MKTDDELIAGFMPDMEYIVPVNKKYSPYWRDKNTLKEYHVDLGYSKDWNRLMPVVEKIRTLAYTVDIDSVAWRRISGHSIFSKITDVYRDTVEFIRWYNEQNVKP